MRSGGKKCAFGKSIAIGVIVSIAISLILSAVVAVLVSGEKIDTEHMGYFMFFISAVSALVGGVTAGKLCDQRLALLVFAVGLIYLFLLMGAGVLLFNGGFHNIGSRLLAVVIGGGISCAICIRGKGTKGKRKRAYR